MPTYVTVDDLVLRMSRVSLAQLGSDSDVIDTVAQANDALADPDVLANINACIEDAEEEVLGYIRGHITDPADAADAIAANVINIAKLKLHGRHRDSNIPDGVLFAAEKSLIWARAVGAGTITLQRDPQIAPSKIRSNFAASRTFTTTSLTGWTPGGFGG